MNPLEPLSSRGNKDHSTISRKFGLVRYCQTFSNHSAPEGTRIIFHEFGAVQHYQTSSNHSAPEGTMVVECSVKW